MSNVQEFLEFVDELLKTSLGTILKVRTVALLAAFKQEKTSVTRGTGTAPLGQSQFPWACVAPSPLALRKHLSMDHAARCVSWSLAQKTHPRVGKVRAMGVRVRFRHAVRLSHVCRSLGAQWERLPFQASATVAKAQVDD